MLNEGRPIRAMQQNPAQSHIHPNNTALLTEARFIKSYPTGIEMHGDRLFVRRLAIEFGMILPTATITFIKSEYSEDGSDRAAKRKQSYNLFDEFL